MFHKISRSFGLLSKGEKAGVFMLALSRIVVNVLDVMGLAALGVLGTLLVGGLTGSSGFTFGGFTFQVQNSQELVTAVLIVAGLFLVKSVLSALALRVTASYLAAIEARYARRIADYLFSGDLQRIKRFSPGELHFNTGQATHAAFSVLLYAGIAIVAETALFSLVIATLLLVDPLTTLFAALYFVVLIGLFQVLVNSRLVRIGERLQTNQVGLTNSVHDLRNAFRELSVVEGRERLVDQFYDYKARHAQDQGLQKFMAQLPRFFVEAGLMVGIVGLVWLQVTAGNIAQGAVTTGIFLAAGMRIMGALLPLQSAVADIRYASPQAARAHKLLEEIPDPSAGRASADQPTPCSVSLLGDRSWAPCQVEAKSVSFSYVDSSTEVLSSLSFSIPAGSMVAFIGPSGSGKTTLVELLLGLLSPVSGTLEIDGLSPRQFRAENPGAIGYVPQRPGMVSGTLAQNVALGVLDSEINEERVHEAIRLAELSKLVSDLPLGIHQNLGSHADALSGGQLQRLGLARAIYTHPGLLVLDEATSALDASTEADIVSNLERIGSKSTRVVIAHRLSTIQRADYIYVLDAGRFSSQGTFREVARESQTVARYIELMEITEIKSQDEN